MAFGYVGTVEPGLGTLGGLIMLGEFAYHRWKDMNRPLAHGDVFQTPRTEPGTLVPVVFGRCRVDQPVIVWVGNKTANEDVYHSPLLIFEGDALYVLGIPFLDGTTRLQGLYLRNLRADDGAGNPNEWGPGHPDPIIVSPKGVLSTSPDFVQVGLEFLDGISTQDLATGTEASSQMVTGGVDATTIPSFRGYATLFVRYSVNTSEIPPLGVELSTYPASDYFPGYFGSFKVGDEANPAHVIAAILCDRFGKLGLSTDVIDSTSFARAATTLAAEGHGYSRCFGGGETAAEMITEVLTQIDGVIYEEPNTGRVALKLIRADYDPASLSLITPSNCTSVSNLERGWGVETPTKIVVNFTSRQNAYQNDIANADNLAAEVAVDGIGPEVSLRFPGCTTPELAAVIAGRELAARSRPLMKCRARVSREFWALRPGDPVRMTYPDYGVSNVVFRVVAVDRAGAADNHLVLDLIEDFYYVHRNSVHPGGLVGNPVPPILEPDVE